MSRTRPSTQPIHVSPQGWSTRRADRVLAVEGLTVSARAERVIAKSSASDISVTRKLIAAAIKK